MGGLKYRHVPAHGPGAWKSEVRVFVRLAASEGCEGESGRAAPLPSVVCQPSLKDPWLAEASALPLPYLP